MEQAPPRHPLKTHSLILWTALNSRRALQKPAPQWIGLLSLLSNSAQPLVLLPSDCRRRCDRLRQLILSWSDGGVLPPTHKTEPLIQ